MHARLLQLCMLICMLLMHKNIKRFTAFLLLCLSLKSVVYLLMSVALLFVCCIYCTLFPNDVKVSFFSRDFKLNKMQQGWKVGESDDCGMRNYKVP